MPSHWERSVHPDYSSSHSQATWSDSSPENESAYWATTHSYTSHSYGTTTICSRNMPAAPQQPAVDELRSRKKKPTSLRSLIRRRPSERDPQQPHSRSQSLSPNAQNDPMRSAPPSVAEYPPTAQRSLSQPPALTRSVSAHHSDLTGYQSSSGYAGSAFLGPRPSQTYPQGLLDPRSGQQRAVSFYENQTTWNSLAPSLPEESRNQRPPSQRAPAQPQSRPSVSEGFDDPADFHLFVEATSGFLDNSVPFSLASPQSPPNPRPNFSIARRPPQLQTNFETPTQPRLQAPAMVQHPDSRTPRQIFAESIQNISGDEEENPDSELPDYAQSQAEETARRRREATMRAAELERRWAAARKHNR